MVPEISTHIDVLCSINFVRTGRKWWYRFIHWIWSAYVTVLQSKKQAMIKFLITNFLCLFSLHEKLVNSFTWPWLAKLPLCFVGRQHYFFKFNNSWHVPQYIYMATVVITFFSFLVSYLSLFQTAFHQFFEEMLASLNTYRETGEKLYKKQVP